MYCTPIVQSASEIEFGCQWSTNPYVMHYRFQTMQLEDNTTRVIGNKYMTNWNATHDRNSGSYAWGLPGRIEKNGRKDKVEIETIINRIR